MILFHHFQLKRSEDVIDSVKIVLCGGLRYVAPYTA